MPANDQCGSVFDECDDRATRGLLLSTFVRNVVYMFVVAIMRYF